MAETAFKTMYREEFIAGFEQRQSLLRETVTTEAMISGNVATFLVADSGGATAVTRGTNGLIPARGDSLSQPAATLVEWHDLVRKTSFNIFSSQGNQRAIMQQTSMSVVNRKIDDDIITELNTGTQTAGATAVKADFGLVLRAKTILGNAEVPWDQNICALITPAFEAYMLQVSEFSDRDYVNGPPGEKADLAWKDRPRAYYWMDMMWIVHPNLPGKGTAAEKCFIYHKSAIGHAYNASNLQALAGYDEEQDYSWARCSIYMGSQLLQNTGIVVVNHDGSEYVAG
jgi:hypothetical protein